MTSTRHSDSTTNPISPPSRRAALAGLGVAAAAAVSQTKPTRAAVPIDLDSPQGNLDGYLKARSDIAGNEALLWKMGYVHAMMPGRPGKRLMMFQGINVTRCLKDDTGYTYLQRECLIWCDPETEAPIATWDNPFTERTNEVFHLLNSAVNSHYDVDGANGPFHMPYLEHSGDIAFYRDLLYLTPSVLTLEDYSPYSSADVYQGAGLYHFHCRRDDLENPDLTSAPALQTHTGVRQWLPWMEMGTWAGQLILPARGKKLSGGAAELPQPLLGWMEKNAPEYLEAPSPDQPEARTSFYQEFKKHIDKKRAQQTSD